MSRSQRFVNLGMSAMRTFPCIGPCNVSNSVNPSKTSRSPFSPVTQAKTNAWCVTRTTEPSVKDEVLRTCMKKICKKRGINCRPIESGGPCHFPHANQRLQLIKQTSYVLNLEFVRSGGCMQECGIMIHVDPSEGKCRFPLLKLNS